MCNMNDIWYDWHAKRRISIKYNHDAHMEDMINDNDMKEDASEVVLYDNENRKMLNYCVFMHQGIPLLFHDSTDAYATRQENDHYVYHNVVMTVVISNGCPISTTTK